jgi:hypothetical protein
MTEPMRESSKQMRSSRLCCPVVELRQYTLHPGKRDILIDLFDREFVESQEALGIKIIGQFRDLEHPDRFVWLRGFRDMTARAKALSDFYSGPVWKAHREAANATMIDSDNVLLLRPALPTSGFSLENMKRPPIGSHEMPTSLVLATIYYFEGPAASDFINFFERTLKPVGDKPGHDSLCVFCDGTQRKHFSSPAGARGRERLRLVFDLSGFGRIRKLRRRSFAIGTMARQSVWRTRELS